MKKIICFLFGHKIVKGLFEDSEVITNKGCSRCGAVLMHFGCHWKGIRSIPCPGRTKKEWEEYVDEKEAALRIKYSQESIMNPL